MVNGGGFGDAVLKTNVCVSYDERTQEKETETKARTSDCCAWLLASSSWRSRRAVQTKWDMVPPPLYFLPFFSSFSLCCGVHAPFLFLIITLTELYTNLDDAGAPVSFHAKPVTLSSDLVRANTITGARRCLSRLLSVLTRLASGTSALLRSSWCLSLTL